jgi:hypothetical protein
MPRILDLFNEASLTSLQFHSPDQGGAWVKHPQYSTGVIVVGAGTGKATINPDNPAVFYNDTDLGGADYPVKAVFESISNFAGVVARMDPSAKTYYVAFFLSGTLYIRRTVAGVITTLASKAFSLPSQPEFLLDIVGQQLTLYVNEEVQLQVTDNAPEKITSQGYAGIYGQGAILLEFSAGVDGGDPEPLTVTEPADLRIYQRNGTSANVTFSGTYDGSPTAIEARIVEHGTSDEVITWTTLDDSPSAGAYSGTLSIPQGGWYNVEVRFANDTEIVANGTHRFGVGVLVCCAGQSNSQQMFTVGSGTPNDTTSRYNGAWGVNAGAGAIALANALNDALAVPVGMIDTGVSGAALTSEGDAGYGYWLNTSGMPWTQWVDRVTDVGGKIELLYWSQGESDAKLSVSSATYSAGLDTLFDRMRTELEQPNLPIILSPLPRRTDSTPDANWNAINDAILSADDGVKTFTGVDTWDLPTADVTHYSATGYMLLGQRFALAGRRALGDPDVYGYGPSIASVHKVSSTELDIELSHAGGDDISPSSGITGLYVTDDNTPIVPTSVVRQSATVIRVAFADEFEGAVRVAVGWGTQPDQTAPPVDNSPLSLPVRRTLSAGVAASLLISLPLTTNGTTPVGDASGLSWALFAESIPDAFTAPVAQGNSGTVVDGLFRVILPDTGLSSGDIGWLVVSDSDGTIDQDPPHRAFAGPVVVL